MSDTQNPDGWPDADRPGVPADPERDGWHWIIGWNRTPFVAQWVADTEQFVGGGIYEWRDGEDVAQGVVAQGWTYGGPCLTPAEVAARVEAARREGIEAAAREMECGCPDETKAAVLEALRDGHNSVKRWQACGHSQCSTIDAFNIRALLEGGR